MRTRRVLGILAVVAVVVVAVILLRGGGGGGSDERQVRSTLTGFAQATAAKDYATICGRYLGPHLLGPLAQIRLPCRSALARGLGHVQAPTLSVTSVKIVSPTTALASVQSGAAGQAPLAGTIELVKVGGDWKLQSLPDQPAKSTP